MCKMYEFPKKLELPKSEKEILLLIGEAYTTALYSALIQLTGDDPTREKMEEVNLLVNQAFTEGMNQAIAKREEGF